MVKANKISFAVAAGALVVAAGAAQAAGSARSPRGADSWFRVWVPAGRPDIVQEEANKRLVMDWYREFWGNQEFDQWRKWMAPDFVNHDPREPRVGAQALVSWLREQMARHPGLAPKKGQAQRARLFFMADGDLVAVLGSPQTDRRYDPEGSITGIAGNIIRVKDGRIAEWWYVGGVAPVAPAGPRPASRAQ